MKPLINDLATLESVWVGHRIGCQSCQQYDGSTASLAHVCIVGAPLIKDILQRQAEPALRAKRKSERDQYKHAMQLDEIPGMDGGRRVSKDRLKRVTRYVSDKETA